MNPYQGGLVRMDLAPGQGNMNIFSCLITVSSQLKLTVGCLYDAPTDAADGLLVNKTKMNQIGDGTDFEVMPTGKFHQGRAICEGAIGSQNVSYHGRR